MHNVTIRALSKREISPEQFGKLLGCTTAHVNDLMSFRVPPTSQEMAIFRLCANVQTRRLAPILESLLDESEWRLIPGYSKYEVSVHGQVRRAAGGHGSMPGLVLKAKTTEWGHKAVNLSDDNGKVKSLGVHVAVCLAFKGERPSPEHMACHWDDIKSNNTPGNVYWGTSLDNSKDRQRNWSWRTSDTLETQTRNSVGPFTLAKMKKIQKKAMTCRLRKLAENGG